MAVSSDDRLIASASAEGNLRLWPGPGDVGQAICSKLTVNPNRKQWNEWVKARRPTKLCPGSRTRARRLETSGESRKCGRCIQVVDYSIVFVGREFYAQICTTVKQEKSSP